MSAIRPELWLLGLELEEKPSPGGVLDLIGRVSRLLHAIVPGLPGNVD